MDESRIKKFMPFAAVAAVALAIGVFVGNWLAKRTVSPTPADSSSTRVLSQQEVQQALPSFTAPQRGGNSPQPISKKVLDSFTAPSH